VQAWSWDIHGLSKRKKNTWSARDVLWYWYRWTNLGINTCHSWWRAKSCRDGLWTLKEFLLISEEDTLHYGNVSAMCVTAISPSWPTGFCGDLVGMHLWLKSQTIAEVVLITAMFCNHLAVARIRKKMQLINSDRNLALKQKLNGRTIEQGILKESSHLQSRSLGKPLYITRYSSLFFPGVLLITVFMMKAQILVCFSR